MGYGLHHTPQLIKNVHKHIKIHFLFVKVVNSQVNKQKPCFGFPQYVFIEKPQIVSLVVQLVNELEVYTYERVSNFLIDKTY